KLNKLNPGPFVEINFDDAARLGITDGHRVEIAFRRGRAVLPAVVTDRVRPGDCFAPFHWNDVFGEYLSINAVTNDAVDPASQQPECKACAISVTKVAVTEADSGAHPAPAVTPPEHEAGRLDHSKQITMPRVDALAEILGIANQPAPQFDPVARSYLAGLVAGL